LRQLDDPQYLLGLAQQLDEIVEDLDALPVRDEQTVASWLALMDAHSLVMTATVLKRLGVWAQYPDADQYVERKNGIQRKNGVQCGAEETERLRAEWLRKYQLPGGTYWKDRAATSKVHLAPVEGPNGSLVSRVAKYTGRPKTW
jgi:hypothetical protein